ncbi:MAG: hypothetical protein ACLFOY_01565 [Desulfatibacillaceae bacterium]
MNFFRSEEHLENWEGYEEKAKGGIITPEAAMELFSGPFFTRRGDPDYFSHYGEYMAAMIEKLDTLDGAGSYWKMNSLEKAGFSVGRKLGFM